MSVHVNSLFLGQKPLPARASPGPRGMLGQNTWDLPHPQMQKERPVPPARQKSRSTSGFPTYLNEIHGLVEKLTSFTVSCLLLPPLVTVVERKSDHTSEDVGMEGFVACTRNSSRPHPQPQCWEKRGNGQVAMPFPDRWSRAWKRPGGQQVQMQALISAKKEGGANLLPLLPPFPQCSFCFLGFISACLREHGSGKETNGKEGWEVGLKNGSGREWYLGKSISSWPKSQWIKNSLVLFSLAQLKVPFSLTPLQLLLIQCK